MARTNMCDICKQETDEIVGKLMYTPLLPGKGANAFHNRYSHHLDVGTCCSAKLLKGFNWTPRVSKAEYDSSRRKTRKPKAQAA